MFRVKSPSMNYGALILCLLVYGQSSMAAPIITTGMTFAEVVKHLKSDGAWRLSGAYHFPWHDTDVDLDDSDVKWVPHGYRAYFYLGDNTCLSITVEKHPGPKPSTVKSFELGMPGERYGNKFQWFDRGDAGMHTYPTQIDLADHRGRFRWRRNTILAFLCCLVFLVFVEKKQRRSGRQQRHLII